MCKVKTQVSIRRYLQQTLLLLIIALSIFSFLGEYHWLSNEQEYEYHSNENKQKNLIILNKMDSINKSYNCDNVKTTKELNVFPYHNLSETFWAANDLLFNTIGNNYSLTSGTLLQMYRNCGLHIDANDIDFITPLQYLSSVKKALTKSKYFVSRDHYPYKEYTPITIGHRLKYEHTNGIKIDIYSFNNQNGIKWAPHFKGRKLFRCFYPNNTKFGYILQVKNYTFPVFGPIDTYLKIRYGKKWIKPMSTHTFHRRWRRRCHYYKKVFF
eukprot:251647_1